MTCILGHSALFTDQGISRFKNLARNPGDSTTKSLSLGLEIGDILLNRAGHESVVLQSLHARANYAIVNLKGAQPRYRARFTVTWPSAPIAVRTQRRL